MLTLLIKDFRLMFSRERTGARGVIRALMSVFFIGCFVAIEIFLFSALLSKIQKFSGAPGAFLLIFLLALSAFMSVSAVFQAKKLFFNEQDIKQLSNHPITNGKMIASKLIFLFIVQYATSLLFEYPVFVAYGMVFSKPVLFYYTALFYPLLASIFEIGVALLVVYPVWMFLQYLKRHVVLEFSLSVALMFALAIPYSKVLNMFVGLVTNNELMLLFTEESMAKLARIGNFAVPIKFLVDFFISKMTTRLVPYLTIALGIFMLGASITVFTFHKVRNLATTEKPKPPKAEYKYTSQVMGLIKKELILLTKNPDYIFSFSGLLIVQPFLLYLIVAAMNAIFSSGTFLYYTTLFPNFVALMDVFLVIMVAVIINGGANQYISIEERTIKNLKTIPVDYRLQLMIKMLIPYTLSAVFLLISVVVLLIGGVISPMTAVASLLLTLTVLFVFDVVSMREELNIRHGKPRSSYLSTLFSYVLPFAYIALVMFLSYRGTSLWLIYLMGLALFWVLGLPQLIKVRRKMGDWFMELEAIN